MNIAIAQIDTTTGAFEQTVNHMLDYAQKLSDQGAELVVFPAQVLTGYNSLASLSYQPFVADLSSALQELSQKLSVPALVPYAQADEQGIMYYEIALIENNTITPLRLTSISRAVSSTGFPQSPETLINEPICFSFHDTTFGVAFDYQTLHTFEIMAQKGDAPDVIIYTPAMGFNVADEASYMAPSVADGHFVSFVDKTQSWLCVANATGAYDDAVFAGGSFIMSPEAKLCCAANNFCEQTIIYDVCSSFALSQPDIQIDSPLPARMSWAALCCALSDFCKKRAIERVVVAVDGTLRTAALLLLAFDALGADRVVVVSTTCDDRPNTQTDVHKIIECAFAYVCGASAHKQKLHEVHVSQAMIAGVVDTLSTLKAGEKTDASANKHDALQYILSFIARSYQACLLSPLDKTMLAVGSIDEDIDAGVYAPFGDVWRSDIVQLLQMHPAHHMLEQTDVMMRLDLPRDLNLDLLHEFLPLTTLLKLDTILALHIEQNKTVDTIARKHHIPYPCVEACLTRLHQRSLKRCKTPLFPIISARTLFERDWSFTTAWEEDPSKDYMSAPAMPSALTASFDMFFANDDKSQDELDESVQDALNQFGSALQHMVDTVEEAFENLPAFSKAPHAPKDNDQERHGLQLNMKDDKQAKRHQEVAGFLRDFAACGGMNTNEGDLWASGMFSDN